MSAYIISYDLRKPGRNYDDLYKRIKSYSGWAHVTESTWCVSAYGQTAARIRDYLNDAIDANDRLFVATLSGEAAWQGLASDVGPWLKQNL